MGDYDAKKKAADEKAAKELKDLRDNFSLSKLLDDQSIIDEDEKEIPLSHFKQEGMITGIYFSAHWFGPCVAFTPKLVEKYDALVKDGKKMGIIFVSFDRDVHNAKEYFADMSWKMLKYEKRDEAQKLAEIFDVEGIPSLTLLDEHGKLITNEGREVLMSTDFDKIKDSQKTVFDTATSALLKIEYPSGRWRQYELGEGDLIAYDRYDESERHCTQWASAPHHIPNMSHFTVQFHILKLLSISYYCIFFVLQLLQAMCMRNTIRQASSVITLSSLSPFL